MKKIVSTLLVSSVLASAIPPINNVSASESIKNENVSLSANKEINDDLSNIQFNPIVDNEKTSSLEVTYGNGKTSLTEYNKETGEIFFDGQLAATVTELPNSTVIEQGLTSSTIVDQPITTFSSNVRYYTIGTPGSGVYTYGYARNFSFKVATGASQLAIAASLAALYLEKKPSIRAAGLIAAAAQIISISSPAQSTYTIRYTHQKDKNKPSYYMDYLSVFRGSSSSGTLLMRITHYFGKVS